jgi:uncharacterized protein (DUF433 family)
MTADTSHLRVLERLVLLAKEHPDVLSSVSQALQESHPDLWSEAKEMDQDDPMFVGSEMAPSVAKDSSGVARVQGSVVAVWEIVRAFRKSGSVQALMAVFPGLTEREIRAALAYAGREPDEVGAQIQAFEDFRSQMNRRRDSHEFAVASVSSWQA